MRTNQILYRAPKWKVIISWLLKRNVEFYIPTSVIKKKSSQIKFNLGFTAQVDPPYSDNYYFWRAMQYNKITDPGKIPISNANRIRIRE